MSQSGDGQAFRYPLPRFNGRLGGWQKRIMELVTKHGADAHMEVTMANDGDYRVMQVLYVTPKKKRQEKS